VVKKHWAAAAVTALAGLGLCGCLDVGSAGPATNLFSQLGGGNVGKLAADLVSSSIQDPRLASLTGGRPVDTAAASGKVSKQLCSMLGGPCQAPLTDDQIADGAGRVTPEQSQAIAGHFNSSLSEATSDPGVRDRVRQAVGNKIPGVLGGIL
jgi:hypothetical protein